MNINDIMLNFPNIKRQNEIMIKEKNTNYDIIMAIPLGKKCFMWFTKYMNKNCCLLIELNGYKINKVSNLNITKINNTLNLGTILLGTCILYDNNKYFSIEDIYYYKGNNYSTHNFIEKLKIIEQLFKNDIISNNNNIIFKIPIMCNNEKELMNKRDKINYKIYTIQYRYLYNKTIYNIKPETYGFNIMNYKKQDIKKVFKVIPDIKNDIYNLYDITNNTFYDIAYIPDYKTSVMMNTLFRNIKENSNLDTLEESDDEDEFENNKLDKYVFLDKEENMVCLYNNKFKKWIPLHIYDKN